MARSDGHGSVDGAAALEASRHANASPAVRRLEVFLIRPTKYDDDGYLLRHARGVLPSNTLACLHALTEDVRRRRLLPGIEVRTHLCDESVQAVPERRIARAARRRGTRVVVGLVGVQTSQFPRAADLARRFRARRLSVIIGGFHVSGSLAMLPEPTRELQALMDAGVTLVSGEVEETWGAMLCDTAAGRLATRYDPIMVKPDLRHAPVPHLDRATLRRFVYRHFGTLDAGRGCPFACSFCTIINVQGRTMRGRDAATIAAAVESNYRATGVHHYFFTDDDFARHPDWRAIFDGLIRLREQRGIPVRFLMQVDVLAHRIRDFIPLARRAGCFQVFIGMESLNPASLVDGGKRQNKVEEYAALIDAWHRAGILTHVGYIIGFAHDSPESVRADLRALREEVRVDLASFFMLSPLPGSADHLKMVQDGVRLDDDLNRYDTFHAVVDHPRMSRAEWDALYQAAWRDFYDRARMERQLARVAPEQHATLLQMYLWYASATRVDRFHPMMTGFLRLKPRTDRRPGVAIESRLRHAVQRLPELAAAVRGYAAVLAELKQLWVATHVAERVRPAGRALASVRRVSLGRRQPVRLWAAFLREMFGARPPEWSYPAAALDRLREDSVATSSATIETPAQP